MPTTLTVESSLFRIDSMTIRNGHGGSIQLAGVVPDSAPVDLRLMATNVPLADLTRLITPLPKPIAGLADVNARFGGTQQDLRVDASAILDSIMIGDVRVGRLMSTAHYQNQRATVGVNISQNAKQVLEASADSVPVSVTLFGYDTLPGRLHATLTADSADFALIQALIPGVSDVKGKMSGQFALDGSWNRPLLAGQFALSDASLRIDTLGIALDGLSGRATYARDTLFIDSTSALRAKSGDSKSSIATLFGRIAFQKWTPSWFDLSLRMKDFEAYNRSELARVVATTDSGPVRLFGTTKADSLTGYVVVSRSNMFLPDRKLAAKQIREPLSLPVDSATNRYGRSADTSATLFQRVTQNLYTSLRVHLGTDVSLSADYAEIPLTGDLNITLATVYSTTAARGAGAYISRLAPEGTIFADRGTYILDFVVVKRDLTVEKGGTITFDRAADWNPYLNLTTRYNVKSSGHPDIPVIVDVQGRLLPNPQLSFRTDAPFPISESDLVSYLLTGQPGFDLAGQTVEYRSLIASVLAPTVSSALSSTLRNRLGTGFDLSVQGAPADFTGKTGSAALTQSLTQFLYSTRINGEMQVSDKLFVSVSAGFCQLNNSYRQSLTQGSVLNQLSDPFGGNLEYRLSSTLRTGSNLQFAIEPSTQALLCSPSNELSLRGAAPTPRQYSLSFLKFWRW
jgi:translocation and assembly module TamB